MGKRVTVRKSDRDPPELQKAWRASQERGCMESWTITEESGQGEKMGGGRKMPRQREETGRALRPVPLSFHPITKGLGALPLSSVWREMRSL